MAKGLKNDPTTETNGRILVALDDYLIPKTGKKFFGCARIV